MKKFFIFFTILCSFLILFGCTSVIEDNVDFEYSIIPSEELSEEEVEAFFDNIDLGSYYVSYSMSMDGESPMIQKHYMNVHDDRVKFKASSFIEGGIFTDMLIILSRGADGEVTGIEKTKVCTMGFCMDDSMLPGGLIDELDFVNFSKPDVSDMELVFVGKENILGVETFCFESKVNYSGEIIQDITCYHPTTLIVMRIYSDDYKLIATELKVGENPSSEFDI